MKPFTIERAADAAVAARAVQARAGAHFIAGGTNLLDLMKLQIETPAHLVDISRLPLSEIEDTPDGGLRIGAMVRNSDLAADRRVRERWPVLAQALLAGASGQLRNMASTGGNLLQRTRCAYFYDTAMACNKRQPGSGCAALQGHNRMHAVLGASDDCIAVHPSDMAVAMAALQAVVRTRGADGGERAIPLADLHRLPGRQPQPDHTLAPGELIVAVDLPAPVGTRQRYRKVRDRASYAFALVSVAAVLELREGVIGRARIALGGVAHMPWRSEAAEAVLSGNPPGEALFAAAADAALRDARGHGHNDFKIPLAKRTLIRTLIDAAGGTA